nr:uncharacterized protein LOC128700607 [Cherax quadricarinatus]
MITLSFPEQESPHSGAASSPSRGQRGVHHEVKRQSPSRGSVRVHHGAATSPPRGAASESLTRGTPESLTGCVRVPSRGAASESLTGGSVQSPSRRGSVRVPSRGAASGVHHEGASSESLTRSASESLTRAASKSLTGGAASEVPHEGSDKSLTRGIVTQSTERLISKKLLPLWLKKKLDGGLLVEVHSPVIPGFSQYFAATVHANTSLVAPLAMQYMKIISHCDTEERFATQWFASSTVISHVTALCYILKSLLKLSFTVGGGADKIRYTADGRLVNSFTIKQITAKGLRQVGVYREDTGVVWSPREMLGSEKLEYGRKGRTLGLVSIEEREKDSAIQSVLLTHEDYVGRTWAFSVLVVACLGVVVSLYVAVYVALRVCDGTLTGPQVLGAILLLGVMGLYASCVVYVLPPTSMTCAVREWAPPMCLALCYGILLVKSMHLRALVSVGVGGEVSQVNLHVSLLFMLSVQGALCVLGHAGGLDIGEEPLVKNGLNGNRQCGQKRIAILATRVYLILLLFLSLILATVNRKIQRNHNEVKHT